MKEAITRYQRCQSSPTAAATANSESSQVPSQQPPSNSIETANSESPPRGRSERLPEISPEKDLLQKYRDMNYGMDAEELIVADKTKYPMLSMFKIPLAPILLQKLSCELVNLQKEHSTCNINNIVEANQTGGNHSYCNVTLLRPSNERSFGKHCFEKLRDLPRALVKDFVTKGMDDNEREEAARKETKKIRTWCINALLDDDDTGESVIAVARKRFNMIEKVKMPAGDIGAMIGLANITPTSFLAIKSFMQTFYGYQMFESKTALRDLYNDAIVPLVDQYIEIDSEIKIDYSYKSIVDTLRLYIKDEMVTGSVRDGKRIHILFSGDHGASRMRFSIKVLVLDSDRDDAKVIAESCIPIGEIDGKDDYLTLKNTLMPRYDTMIKNLNTKTVCINADDDIIIADNLIPGSTCSMPIQFFLIGDYKFTGSIRGRIDRAQYYCDWCQLRDAQWKLNSIDGLPLTIADIDHNYAKDTTLAPQKLGCVEKNLLTSIDTNNTLIGLLHQLLGTGNDVRKSVLNFIDTEFEKLSEDNESLHEAWITAEIQLDTKKSRLQQIEQNLGRIAMSITALRVAYNAIPNTEERTRQFNTLVNAAIGNERTLKEHKLTIVTEVKTARKAFNAAKKKLKDSLGSRKYNEKPVRVKLYEIFKKYGIRPEQYHGGEFVGNHCRILMSKGRMIMQEIAAMLKLLPVNRRRKRGGSANVVSDEEIDEKLNTLSDLLILADLIYSTCHQPAGSLTDADVQKSQEIIQTFSDMWRNCDMVSLTRKAHNIEKHLFTYLRRFRGLKEYDESFIERDHQRGAQYHLRSSNVKKYDDLAKIHSSWERLTRNPRVASARKNYENSRRKRRTSEGVILRQSEEKRIKTEGREEVFARCRRGG